MGPGFDNDDFDNTGFGVARHKLACLFVDASVRKPQNP